MFLFKEREYEFYFTTNFIFFFIDFSKANTSVILTLIDEGNGFNDIRFKGGFSNWDVLQGYDDGSNGDTIAGDGIWTIVLMSCQDRLL